MFVGCADNYFNRRVLQPVLFLLQNQPFGLLAHHQGKQCNSFQPGWWKVPVKFLSKNIIDRSDDNKNDNKNDDNDGDDGYEMMTRRVILIIMVVVVVKCPMIIKLHTLWVLQWKTSAIMMTHSSSSTCIQGNYMVNCDGIVIIIFVLL